MSEQTKRLIETIEAAELRILNDKYGKGGWEGLISKQSDEALLNICKQELCELQAAQEEKEYMEAVAAQEEQHLQDTKQKQAAVTITETGGEVSLKLEFATFEDYADYKELEMTYEGAEDDVNDLMSIAIQLSASDSQIIYNEGSECCDCLGCCEGTEEEEGYEDVFIKFTPEELQTIHQVLGFVQGSEEAYSILSKISPYTDEEYVEDGFGKVRLVNEEDLPMFKDGIKLQENYFSLVIDK